MTTLISIVIVVVTAATVGSVVASICLYLERRAESRVDRLAAIKRRCDSIINQKQ